MKESKDDELVTMAIRIPKYKKEIIKNLAKEQGRKQITMLIKILLE